MFPSLLPTLCLLGMINRSDSPISLRSVTGGQGVSEWQGYCCPWLCSTVVAGMTESTPKREYRASQCLLRMWHGCQQCGWSPRWVTRGCLRMPLTVQVTGQQQCPEGLQPSLTLHAIFLLGSRAGKHERNQETPALPHLSLSRAPKLVSTILCPLSVDTFVPHAAGVMKEKDISSPEPGTPTSASCPSLSPPGSSQKEVMPVALLPCPHCYFQLPSETVPLGASITDQ